MKDLKIIAGVLLICAFTSCKKDQLETLPQENFSEASVQQKSNEPEWTTASQWNMAERPSHTVFHTNLSSASVTTAAAEQGLLRVFKKDQSGKINALPFEETIGGQKVYWYYEATDGNVMIAADVYGSKSNPAANSSFQYMILEKYAVQDLERKGTSKKMLLQMSYDDLNKMNN